MIGKPVAIAIGLAVCLAIPAAVLVSAETTVSTTRAAPAGEQSTSVSAASHNHPVVPRGPSIRRSAAQVVASVPMPQSQSRRVVAIVNTSTGPRVTTHLVADAAAATSTVAALQRRPAVATVSIDTRTHATADYTNSQWALPKLHASSTWTRSTGSGVTVAVIDTGVQATHPDLAGRVLSGAQFLNGSASSSGNGQTDGHGHGTHVAGIVAANHDGSLVTGIAPEASVLPVRVLDSNGSGWNSDVDRGILWAADHGADVINMSLGGGSASDTDAAAVAYAADKGVAVFAAAGNGGPSAAPSYPGAYPGAEAVSATDYTNAVASFSNQGSYVDLAAPGVSILSDYPTSTVATMSGTSMATPYAAGSAADVLARLRLRAPKAKGADVINALRATAVDLGAVGRDNTFGYGLVNPDAAITSLEPISSSPSGTATSSTSESPTTASPTASSASPTASHSATSPETGSPTATSPTSEAPSPSESTTAPEQAPSTPGIGGVSVGKANVALRVVGPTSAGSAALIGYQASCNSAGRVTRSATAGAAARSITVGQLVGGATYSCAIRATNGLWSDWSGSAVFTARDVPGAPAITSVKISRVRLTPAQRVRAVRVQATNAATVSFVAPSPVNPAIANFTAQCSSSGRPTVERNGTGSPVSVAGLRTGGSYKCRVRATNSLGTGLWSDYIAVASTRSARR